MVMILSAPAKINLFLQVTGRRSDGYHELRSLMCCVGLFDTLTLTIGTDQSGIECNHPDVPGDKTNLAFQAAQLYGRELESHTGICPHNVFIKLDKTIPVGAGLGGGSSNAAAVLKGLNRHYKEPFSRADLGSMAVRLGADVPFFIDAVPSLATGIGERLTPIRGLSPLEVLLVYPGFGISTAEAFKNLNLRLTKCEKKLRNLSFDATGFDAVRYLCNDLETAVAKRYPVIEEIKKELIKQGAKGALMTGSGSTVFGIFSSATDSRKAEKVFARHNGWAVFATRLLLAPIGLNH
jgi:4-diphosphocytidyl-2-C-methyl-D-erythritol kinase